MKSTQLAGNDEQYASALALAANRLGIPTRVVVGAMPAQDGTVKGKDVHAWVEVRTSDGAWEPVLQTAFLPDRNKKPQQLLTKSEEKKTGAQVPPPAANNPPSVLQGPDQAQNATQLKNPPKDDENPLDPSTWPDWLRYLLFFVVFPLLVLLLVYGAIRLAKWVRRRRRRTRGATASRVTGGWRELVDTARDLRMPVPVKGTRLEQARALEEHVFGPPPEKPSPVVDGALMGAPVRVESSAHVAPGPERGSSSPGGGASPTRSQPRARAPRGVGRTATSSTSTSRRPTRSTPSGPTSRPPAGGSAASRASGRRCEATCRCAPSATTCPTAPAWRRHCVARRAARGPVGRARPRRGAAGPTKAGIGTTAPTDQRRRRGQKGEP